MTRARLPSSAKVHATLGRGLDWIWPTGAAWAYGDAIRHAPRSAELHFLRGRALERADCWHDAAIAFERATEIEPTSLEYQGALAVALHHARRETALVEALRRLAQLRPGQGEIHVLIGALLRRSGKNADALRAFRLGVRLAPGPTARRFVLGEILLGREGWEQTVDAWQEAQQLEAGKAPAVRPGHSALNSHPGRTLDPPLRPRLPVRRRTPAVLAGLRHGWSALRSSWQGLVDRGARGITLEQRVRALRRAWQKAQPRGARRPARGGTA
jgi:tetratricopeptide (TPR) repeat protein